MTRKLAVALVAVMIGSLGVVTAEAAAHHKNPRAARVYLLRSIQHRYAESGHSVDYGAETFRCWYAGLHTTRCWFNVRLDDGAFWSCGYGTVAHGREPGWWITWSARPSNCQYD